MYLKMKYTIILLILIKQLISQVWIKQLVDIQQYRYESLEILQPPLTLINAVVYLKVDPEEKKVNLYFLDLEDNEAQYLGLGKKDTEIIEGHKVYTLTFEIIHCNYFLTMFFKSQHVSFFYFLNNVRYFELAALGHELYERQKVFRDFEELKENEGIGNIGYDEKTGTAVQARVQATITITRNERISELLEALQRNPSVKDFRDMLIILRLSNRSAVVKYVKDNVSLINRMLGELDEKVEFDLISKPEPLKSVYALFINFFESWNENEIQKNLRYYNQRVNDLINTCINVTAELFMSELGTINHFEHLGELKIFGGYLFHKYFNFERSNKLQTIFLDFLREVVGHRQFNYLAYNTNDPEITCEEKVDFYLTLKKSYNSLKGEIDINAWGSSIEPSSIAPDEESGFSFYKGLIEIDWSNDLAEFINENFKYSDIRDKESFFDEDAPVAPLVSDRFYEPWKEVTGSDLQCLYEQP
jgi:hypothetical protein